jgi:hypothetical protein
MPVHFLSFFESQNLYELNGNFCTHGPVKRAWLTTFLINSTSQSYCTVFTVRKRKDKPVTFCTVSTATVPVPTAGPASLRGH